LDVGGDLGVVRTEASLVDPERPLVGRPGSRQIAQVFQHRAQVVDADGDIGVAGAEALLVDPERPLEGRPGARQIAQVFQHPA
jgi:hypothetical protein